MSCKSLKGKKIGIVFLISSLKVTPNDKLSMFLRHNARQFLPVNLSIFLSLRFTGLRTGVNGTAYNTSQHTYLNP